MRGILRLLHFFGLVLFLGSILTFAIVSAVSVSGDLASLAVARRVIGAGTFFLTLPGLGILVISGICMVWGRARHVRQLWLQIMTLSALVIVINAVLVVVPAERSATTMAQEALAAGVLPAGQARAYTTESVAGGINIVLALLAMASGVFRFDARGVTPS